MDTNMTGAAADDAGIALASPFQLPGETESPQPPLEPREPLARPVAGPPRRRLFSWRAGVSDPHGEGDPLPPSGVSTETSAPKQRNANRNVLLATAVGLIGAGAAGFAIYRIGTVAAVDKTEAVFNGVGGKAKTVMATEGKPVPDAKPEQRVAAAAAALMPQGHGASAGAPSSPLPVGPLPAPVRLVPTVPTPPPVPATLAPPATPAVPAPPPVPAIPAAKDDDEGLDDFVLLRRLPRGTMQGPAEVGVTPNPALPPSAVTVASPAAHDTPTVTLPPAVSQGGPPAEKQLAPVTLPPSVGTQVVTGAAGPDPNNPVLSGPPVSSGPRDPVERVEAIQAAPMAPAAQVEVLDLVKELAGQLRDTRSQMAKMHETVANLAHQVETRTTDFEGRLNLVETRDVLSASAKAGDATGADAAPPKPTRFASIRPTAPVAPAPVPMPPQPEAERRTVKDYVVKGASPGLAVLAALNPPSGTRGVIEVAVGDTVPGVGQVRQIVQRGTTWVVQTDGGAIQP